MTLILFKKDGEVAQDPVSILTILTNAMISYFEYLWKMLWPKGLAILYAHPGNTLAVWKGVLCGIALLAITTISIKLIRKAPYFLVGWFWYLGTLIPVIGFIPLGLHLIADRYAYLPLIGIFIIVAWGLPELMAKWHHKKKVLSILAGVLILILMPITWIQVSHWKSSITIFEHAIKVTDKKYPDFGLVHNNLGVALVAEGKNEEAIYHYKVAIRLKPDFADAYNNLGVSLISEGKNEEGISHHKVAIKLNPDNAVAHYNLGVSLVAEGENEEAISHYKVAIRLQPNYALAHNNLGSALVAEGKNEEAIFHYKIAIKLNPDFVLAHYNLGNTLRRKGRNGEAISHYKMTIKLNPDFADAYNNLGALLFNTKMTEEAIGYFKEAIRIRPGFASAQKNLETALLQSQKLE
jgi:tetratricopeptide (TPR) repeat protein